jgi:transposase
MAQPTPEVIRLSPAELDALLAQLRTHLPSPVFEVVQAALQTLQWVLEAMELKTTTIARLKRVLFGFQSEKTKRLFPEPATSAPGARDADPSPPAGQKPKRRGHGRRRAQTYTGAQRIDVPHPDLHAGDRCPECSGTLGAKTPARVVCLQAQPLFRATLYEAQVLRCNRCQKVFTAPLPPQAQQAKYDPTVGDMLGLVRFGMGVPMYRTAQWQQDLGVPLPASTQWELMAAAAEPRQPIFQAMIQAAAQGTLLHTDDTPMRVQSLRRQIDQAGDQAERTGIFTTGLIAKLGTGERVALYFTGSRHAGENLDQVLQHRAAGLGPPLHMCDGLARNGSKDFETILCNCTTHGRRQFTDVRESFPVECRQVIEELREVYRHDAQAREQHFADDQRLRFHQEHSQPVMDRLHRWMTDQLEQKRVEPNSGLGQAINYMLKRWEPLTRFLKLPGAPLDNNICEQGLKFAIQHRKNSLSFKTLRGAMVGDFFMSVIQTCRLNRINPVEYLAALRQHAKAALQNPAAWLPWNYRQVLAALDTS